MRILSIRPEPPGGNTVARFDVALTDELRLYGLRLRRAADGRHLTYAPTCDGKRYASFVPALAEKITQAAVAAMESREAYEYNSRAA